MPLIDQDLNQLTDRQLIDMTRLGSQAAFAIAIERHYRACVNIATSILHDRGDAQDEVQKSCCKAFEHINQYHGEAEFVVWLMRIVANQCRMLIRSRKRVRFVHIDAKSDRENSVPVELPALSDDPERMLLDLETHDILHREIRCIPPLFRNVLLMHDVEQLPISDVAARLSITVPAAKSRLLRARIELKDRLMRRYGKTKTNARTSKECFVQALAPEAAESRHSKRAA